MNFRPHKCYVIIFGRLRLSACKTVCKYSVIWLFQNCGRTLAICGVCVCCRNLIDGTIDGTIDCEKVKICGTFLHPVLPVWQLKWSSIRRSSSDQCEAQRQTELIVLQRKLLCKTKLINHSDLVISFDPAKRFIRFWESFKYRSLLVSLFATSPLPCRFPLFPDWAIFCLAFLVWEFQSARHHRWSQIVARCHRRLGLLTWES